jgi:hypothetical protein
MNKPPFPTRSPTNWGGSGITEPIFNWIRAHLPDGKHVLELGSGDVSTWYLSEHYRVTSVEDNPQYWDKYPSHYIKAPQVNGWYDLAILEAQLPKDYDLLLVDGPCGSHPRIGFLKNLRLFRTDVPIVIDDTWREIERKMADDVAKLTGAKLEVYEHFCALVPSQPDYSAQSAPAAEAQSPKP